MSKKYEVVGTLSEINFNDAIVKDCKKNKVTINKKILKTLALSAATILISTALQDYAYAAETTNELVQGFSSSYENTTALASNPYKAPEKLSTLLNFIDWLIWLFRVIVSSVIGLIATYAGFKWATDITGEGQGKAKKILKNCFVGALLVWTGSSIADYFVGTLNKILV